MKIDEAITREKEKAKEKRKEMQCKTCKLFARSDLHPLQGYCRKNEYRSIEIDSWRKVCSEYVPKEMCKCAEEHEQLAEWLEELKALKDNSISRETFERMKSKSYKKGYRQGYNKAIDDFAEKAIQIVYYSDDRNINPQPRDMVADIHYKLLDLAEQLKAYVDRL